ncbi:MAG: SGNH/GDSL hydrolase family protein [Planctomycetes bacterium]|nr:SGNH/GDSL hydrolase family protein [Planctomycetota bacterium]
MSELRGSTVNAQRWAAFSLSLSVALCGASAVLFWQSRVRARSVELDIDTRGYDPQAPPALAPEDADVPSVLECAHPLYPRSTFRRTAWDPADFPQPTAARGNPLRFDPQSGFMFSGGMDRRRAWAEHPAGGWSVRTNSFGLRDDDEPATERPDLRIVVLGDSHTAGFCNNRESFAQLVEARLGSTRPAQRIEALNAAVPGYTFQHYLGALERMLAFAPDVAIIAFYGGNDFGETLGHQHRAHQTARGDLAAVQARLERVQDEDPELVSQALFSVEQFRFDPPQVEVALQAARDVLTEIQVTCSRFGVVPLVVYVPSSLEVEFERRRARFEAALAALGATREDCAVLDRLADSTLGFLASRGCATLDLRPAFRASAAKLYWDEDFHLAVEGHALAAREIAASLERIVPPDARRVRRGSPSLDGDARRALLSPGAGEPVK